jgi:hypothetical protein
MFPWMREQMSCAEAVRVFVRENAPFLQLLEKELYGLPLQFRCDAENAISNGHFNMAVPEIVLTEPPRALGAQRTREDLLVTLHHELIHASDCILEDFDTNGACFRRFRRFLCRCLTAALQTRTRWRAQRFGRTTGPTAPAGSSLLRRAREAEQCQACAIT